MTPLTEAVVPIKSVPLQPAQPWLQTSGAPFWILVAVTVICIVGLALRPPNRVVRRALQTTLTTAAAVLAISGVLGLTFTASGAHDSQRAAADLAQSYDLTSESRDRLAPRNCFGCGLIPADGGFVEGPFDIESQDGTVWPRGTWRVMSDDGRAWLAALDGVRVVELGTEAK